MGYKSVHFGQNQANQLQGKNSDDYEIKPNQLIFAEDLDILNQFRLNQEIHEAIDPLGDARSPFFSGGFYGI